MNYILEIKAFEQWLETHYLPIQPQLLWHKLMYFCNRSGWSEWMTVDNLRLMAAMQMGREATLIKARDELIKAGLIECRKGRKGCPNRYRIISLVEQNAFKNATQNEVENAVESEVQSEAESAAQSRVKDRNTFKNAVYPAVKSEVKSVVYPAVKSVDIYKHKQEHKLKHKNTPPISPAERFEEFLAAYPKGCNRFLAEREYASLLLSGKTTEGGLVQSAVNYAEACRIRGTLERYVKNVENFLKEHAFEAYLPGNYKKPAPERAKRGFHNFPQREYDFDELERRLLGKGACAK